MTGPEHYRAGEVILRNVQGDLTSGDPLDSTWLLAAQVHATLALAAATADTAVIRYEERNEWDRATGRLTDASEVSR